MSPTRVDPPLIRRARRLRKTMTEGEKRLWNELKSFRKLYGIHARKQVPIGPYVPDFAIHSARLIVEVDGEFHFEPERFARDAIRDAWLKRQGYRVLRFNTGEIDTDLDGCIEEVLIALGLRH
ncbi:endonuclease domain-containing protein [Aurantimonas marina]|uniref:endonuclease domain-containing protein n=1 Tax=Aurantimonas marina TaxID=2780508 RepID=UPI0019D27DA2|nr:DUF559 domain-containing protein [Aurantimonas marina]